jgi:hypothetical protein
MGTNFAPDSFTGELPSWKDIEEVADWDGLIVGNGASINLWSKFQYASLFEQAKKSGLFAPDDEDLFKKLGTENFEDVLHALSESIRIGNALGKERTTEHERHFGIQKALAKAVQRVHVSGGEIPESTFETIYEELRNYRHVFTTSYDLILYWSAAKGGERPFEGFRDFLWANDRNAFDESTIRRDSTWSGTRLYFLHGALHLVALPDGTTCKRKTSMWSLLDQFG